MAAADKRNLTLLTDLYQLTMISSYFESGIHRREAVFDLYFRHNGQINYAVSAGLAQAVDYINGLRFTAGDLEYLRSLNLFSEEFLSCLKTLRFTGDLYAVPEGTVVFPDEPIVTVKAPMLEAQLIESALLNIVNHQTLIATKASRIVQIAGEGKVVEFGLRRAQGPDAGIYGARAAVIGGCVGTSNVYAGKEFGLRLKGTHAHSYVLAHSSELEAFRSYAKRYPDDCLLLVDTFDTLKSGVPNAITVFNELRAAGHKPLGIRLDSGDLAYLSKQARRMLDEAGFNDAVIFASSDIDENVIAGLKLQGAKIDMWGVGTRLITSENMPSLGGVYKLCAAEGADGELRPKMKFSDSYIKVTNPGFKELYRIYDNEGYAFADLITLRGEELSTPLKLTHPVERWKSTVLEEYSAKKLLVTVFKGGKQVYECPSAEVAADYARADLNSFWDEYKRLISPHIYKVDISDELYELKQSFLRKGRGE